MTNNNDDKNTDKSLLLDHNYDGIQELDNPLPNWWLILFFITVGFGVLYFIHHQLGGGGRNSVQELEASMQKIEVQKLKAHAGHDHGQPSAEASTQNLEAMLSDPTVLAQGKTVFDTNCASCHGKAGEGTIGPNLTDKFWIHGQGDMASVIKVVQIGVLDKGMPPWGTVLPADKINAVAAYIVSLKGSNPANGKAPQGAEVK